jgi:NADH-quinone oxidoreductase subunit C
MTNPTHDPHKPSSRDPQGKNWNPQGTPTGYQAFTAPRESAPQEGVAATYAERTALALRERYPSETLQIAAFRGEITAVLRPERLLDFMKFLRDDWGYTMCHDVTSVDLYPHEPRFMVVYHLLNLEQAVRFRVKCPLPGETPEIESVVPLWKGADYTEREVYDMMGIVFLHHPDLRRILMPADYEHFPMRKDFPLTGFPVGIDALKD